MLEIGLSANDRHSANGYQTWPVRETGSEPGALSRHTRATQGRPFAGNAAEYVGRGIQRNELGRPDLVGCQVCEFGSCCDPTSPANRCRSSVRVRETGCGPWAVSRFSSAMQMRSFAEQSSNADSIRRARRASGATE